MIAYINPEKADYILTRPSDMPKSADEKSLTATWIKIFVIIGIFTALGVTLFVVSLMGGKRTLLARAVMALAFALVMDVYVICRFIKVKVVSPGRFKKTLAKFGKEQLKAQIEDPAAVGFFVDENEYENVILLTADYMIQAQEFVYALKDLKAVTLSKTDVSEERVKKMKSEHLRNVLRRTYTMDITLTDGSRRKEVIAINSTDMQAFFGYIHQRAPQVVLQYK